MTVPRSSAAGHSRANRREGSGSSGAGPSSWRFRFALLAAAVLGAALAIPTFFAIADDPVPSPGCANSHANEAVYDAGNTGNIQGVHSQINSTQFSDQQCESIRSVLAYGSQSQGLEIGWMALTGQNHHVYMFRLEDNIPHFDWTGEFLADGTDHGFKIQNSDGADNWWSLKLDDNQKDLKHANFSTAPRAVENSERHKGDDDLNAHFGNISVCTQKSSDCNYHNPDNLKRWLDDTDWNICIDSNTEVRVRHNSC